MVNLDRIEEGLKCFAKGACLLKLLTIDDGWLNAVIDDPCEGETPTDGLKYAAKLADFEENAKFRRPNAENSYSNSRYWGGVLPTSEKMKKYNPSYVFPVLFPGNIAHVMCTMMHSVTETGIGVIDPAEVDEFFNDLHCYLVSCGVDGVKVDVQNILETIAYGRGRRVELQSQQHYRLDEPKHGEHLLVRLVHPPTKRVITSSMSHILLFLSNLPCNSKKLAASRISEDFMPNEPTFQTLHIFTVAFSSLLQGEFVMPDWDMFYSDHYTAVFHAAARSISRCPIYVSDMPGSHNFSIIKKLVLLDSFILRCQKAGPPTRDCLFNDPVMDGKSLLKIWNVNKLSGVIGVFNCQRAGNWPLIVGTLCVSLSDCAPPIIGHVSPIDKDLESLCRQKLEWSLYAFQSGLVGS